MPHSISLSVEELFEAAFQRSESDRAAYVASVCADEEVRREVFQLLALAQTPHDDILEAESFSALFAIKEGEVLGGRFRIVAEIGHGGMGSVYEAEDQLLHKRKAVKVIHPEYILDEVVRERFLLEAKLAQQISHRNVCRIHDLGTHLRRGQTIHFLTMELLRGETLAARISRKRFTGKEALPLLNEIAAGLDAAHAQGVVHRDLKPANIMLVPDGQMCVRAIITDFGIAQHIDKRVQDALTKTGQEPGTDYYMDRGRHDGQHGKGVDIYALGLIAYAMLAGEPPLPIDDYKLRAAVGWHNGRRWKFAISKCLRDPKQRWLSAAEFVKELKHSRSFPVAALIAICIALILVLWFSIRSAQRVIDLKALAGAGVWKKDITEPRSISTKLAVLPLHLTGLVPDSVAGLIEAVCVRLTQCPDLTVYGSPVGRLPSSDGSTIAKMLGVTRLLTGVAHAQDEDIILTLKLQDSTTGGIIWTRDFRAPREQILTLQETIFSEVSKALGIKVQPPLRKTTTNPDAFELYQKGRVALRNAKSAKTVQGAIKLFEASLKKDPQFAVAEAGLADAFMAMYRETKDDIWFKQATNVVHRAQADGEGIPEVNFAVGIFYTTRGQYEDAVTELKKALSFLPNSDEGYRRLGYAYLKWGHKSESLTAYQRAVKINPNYWNNYHQLGGAYFQFGYNQEARECFERVIELEPQYSYGYESLGIVKFKLGEYPAASTAYKKALSIQKHAETYSNLGTTYFYMKQYSDSAEMFKKAIDAQPNNAQSRGNLGDAYRAMNRLTEAHTAYKEAISLGFKDLNVNPHSVSAMGTIALCYAKQGQDSPALRYMRQARALHPDDTNLIYSEALVHAIAGRQRDALDLLREAIQKGYSPAQIGAEPDFQRLDKLAELASVQKGK